MTLLNSRRRAYLPLQGAALLALTVCGTACPFDPPSTNETEGGSEADSGNDGPDGSTGLTTGATTDPGDDTSTSAPSDTTAGDDAANVCGDGVRGGDEQCDGTDFGDSACTDFDSGVQEWNFTGGDLGCTADCQVDTTACTFSCERSGCTEACDEETQHCIECNEDTDCGGGTPFCVDQACVTCSVAGCPEDNPTCAPSGQCVAAPRTVFLSSNRYSGAMGGLAGADAICNQLALTAGLSGTYMAWLSDNNSSVEDRFDHSNGPYQLVNGTLLATDWDDLTDGELLAPINVDENGSVIMVTTEAPFCDAAEEVWTGTFASASPSTSELCGDWTDASAGGSMKGSMQHTDDNWSFDCTSTDCDGPAYLYCFEQ